jgi:hypothetical protein
MESILTLPLKLIDPSLRSNVRVLGHGKGRKVCYLKSYEHARYGRTT